MKRRIIVFFITFFVLVITVLGIIFLIGPLTLTNRTRMALESKVYVGMTRSEVISSLGEPDHIAKSKDEIRVVNFDPKPTRTVEKEVLEYNNFVWRVYVYIDFADRVSAVHLSRT